MQIGLEYTAILNVEQQHLAVNVGSGDLEVLATPAMIALMENASMMAVKDALEEGQTTVVNNFNGGTTSALSAEMGKKLNNEKQNIIGYGTEVPTLAEGEIFIQIFE